MTKLFQRIWNSWLWLIPLLISLIVTTVWVWQSFFYEDDRIVGPVRVNSQTIKNLEIAIIHPTTVSSDDRSVNAKQVTVTTRSDDHPPVESVLIDFRIPVGIVNFVNKDKNKTSGRIKLPLERGSVPTSVWLEHANTSLASSHREVLIETFVSIPRPPLDHEEVRTPELDLRIRIEPWWSQRLRNMARSSLGPIAPLSFVALLVGFSVRRRLMTKRIEPMYLEMQGNKTRKRWAEAANNCREIIKFDPLYDDIQQEFIEIIREEGEQSKRLKVLFIEATIAYRSQEWAEAKRLLEEIISERDDYENTVELLAEVTGKLNEAKKLNELYERGVSLEVAGEIREAIKCFQEVVTSSPGYKDAQQRLLRLQSYLSRRIAAEPHFMRMLLARPEIDFQYMAASIDKSERNVSEILLELTHDDDVNVRRNLATVVSYMESPIAKRIASRLMEDSDAEVRAKASSAIMRRGEIDELIRQLREPDLWREAGGELLKRGEAAVQPLISALREEFPVWERARQVLQAMGEVARPALMESLTIGDQLSKERISLILSDSREQSSFEHIDNPED